jgi:adenylate cyclase
MWQLIINGPGYFDTPYDLPEGATHLGRADENDIVLSGDLVSRRHARFKARGDELQVEDLGSRNGSKVNGEPLKGVAALKAGDTVTVGENTLAVRQPTQVESAATEMVNLDARGIRRFGRGADIGSAVITSRDLQDSVILRALDNVAPPASEPGPIPFANEIARQVNYEWLLTLYKTAELLSSANDLQEFLERTADRVMERARATTAVVLLRHASGVMLPAAVRHSGKLARGEVPVSDAIIDAALAKGAALAVADVREDRRFAARESVILYGADQVLCIPIRNKDGFAGVLYLNRAAGDTEELTHLLDLCTAMAHLISTGLQRFRAEASPPDERLRRALGRSHPPEILERRVAELRSGPVTQLDDRLCTLLYADLVDFQNVVVNAGPQQILDLVNDFSQRMTGVVFSFEGSVDRVSGDTLLAVFGAPYPQGDDALRAVRCALALRAEWERTVLRHPEEARCTLRIGLHTARVLAGTVGTDLRLDFTVLGEPVKVASALCGTAEGGQILITGKTLAAVGARFDVTPLGERALQPGRERVAAFEVVEEDAAQHTSPGLR